MPPAGLGPRFVSDNTSGQCRRFSLCCAFILVEAIDGGNNVPGPAAIRPRFDGIAAALYTSRNHANGDHSEMSNEHMAPRNNSSHFFHVLPRWGAPLTRSAELIRLGTRMTLFPPG
jgi:hypothetical protein